MLLGISTLVACALVVTKVADLLTTWRHVSVVGESNPIGRALFVRWGKPAGLAVVGMVSMLAIGASWWGAWRMGTPGLLGFSALGSFIAAVQAAVAHHNATGQANAVTRVVASFHGRWARRNRNW